MPNEEPIPHAVLPIVPSTEEEAAAYLANQKSTKGRWQRFVSFVWDPDYYEKSDAERHLVHKLDCGILIAIVFSYIMKAIDQSNIGNAYVTGMREDLSMFGNQYTYCLVIYNAVYCFMQIPSNFLCLKFRPSVVLASCEIGWGIATFAQAGAQNYQQVYVFRFFVGLFEAPFQPATALLLGSWYSPPELAKRVAVWFLAARSGSAFSGFLTAAINSGMDGYAGLAGWRWLYIICGIMTLPAGASLYFLLPDYPSTTKVWYLTEEEKLMAQARCARQGTKPHTGIVNFQTFKRIIKRWPFWVMTPTYLFYAWCVQAYTVFAPYLLQMNYPKSLRTIYPAVSDIIGLPFVFLWGFLSDRTGSRYLFTLIPSLWALVPNGILAAYAPSRSLRLFAYLACHTYFVTHIFFTWVNEICKNDAEERAFVIGASNCFFYAFNSWLPTLLTLQTDGPKWTMGFWSFFGSNVISCFTLTLAWVLHRRQLREEARQHQIAGTEGGAIEAETVLVDDEKDPKALDT